MRKNRKSFYYLGICLLLLLWWGGWHFFPQAQGMSNQPQIIHTLERLSFGITSQQIAKVSKIGLDNYLQEQLNPSSIKESSQLQNQLAQLNTIEQKSFDLYQTFQQYDRQLKDKKATNLSAEAKRKLQQKRNQYRSKVLREARQAHLIRAIASSRQLQEVMTDFWLNHFSVFGSKRIIPFWLADYENDLREVALGNFRDLLGVSAHHPAMLVYLDNDLNTDPKNPRRQGNAKGLNENYARELMELHTLGVDGGYTQQDVTTLARILTGWGLDYTGKQGDENNFRFFPERHDNTDKIFLGNQISGGGITEGEQALDMLASHPSTARFISYKLAQYFVADKPPETLVDKLSQTFLESQGSIKTVLATLFNSSEFSDRQYYHVKFKTPFQYLVSVVRVSNLNNPDLKKIEGMLSQLSMPIFGCPTPNGYQNTEEAWLNPDAMLRRLSYVTNIANGVLDRQKSLDLATIQQNLDYNLTEKTRQAIAESPPNLKAALILGSPEMMYR